MARTVFVDTSGFYAALTPLDPFSPQSAALFLRAREEHWQLITTNYVLHETWALIQKRFGWEALDALNSVLASMCEIHFITADLHKKAAERCARARLRSLSLTDCSSFEVMAALNVTEVIASDRHFASAGFKLPV
jgi:predicted nucleic acid-binding protein